MLACAEGYFDTAQDRRTKRCEAVAEVARVKADQLATVWHSATVVRFVVRLQARVRGRRTRLLAPASVRQEQREAAQQRDDHEAARHGSEPIDLAIASAEREARAASTAVLTKKRSLAKLLPAANGHREAPPPPPQSLNCLTRCLLASTKARG